MFDFGPEVHSVIGFVRGYIIDPFIASYIRLIYTICVIDAQR